MNKPWGISYKVSVGQLWFMTQLLVMGRVKRCSGYKSVLQEVSVRLGRDAFLRYVHPSISVIVEFLF